MMYQGHGAKKWIFADRPNRRDLHQRSFIPDRPYLRQAKAEFEPESADTSPEMLILPPARLVSLPGQRLGHTPSLPVK